MKAPLAGSVIEVLVSVGQQVSEGDPVIILEAMKMQNDLHARRAGTVKAVYTSIGERVEQGTKLLVVL